MSTAAPLQSTAAKSPSVSKSSHAGLLLQRKCACGGPAVSSLTGECDICKNNRLQTKLSIGASNDPLEQEADRVADQVLATPAHSAVSGTPPRIQRCTGQPSGQADTAPASVDRVLTGSGRPLDTALQQDMGQRLGYDFSRVRVHTGSEAAESAQAVNALAYTVGHNIVFGAGRFAPGSHEGRKLIAHELTHVVQQSVANGVRSGQSNEKRGLSPRSVPHVIQAKLRVSQPTDPYEEEADRIAEQSLSSTARLKVCSLTRTPVSSSSWPVAPDRVNAVEASLHGGEPLSQPLREFFESRFGFDLRSVRVHADERAACGAQALRARAFASGPHLVFGAGEYAPHTSAGRRLIAHELAHVMQQDAAGAPRVQRHNAADTRLPADQPEAFTFAAAANTEIQAALTRLAAASGLLEQNVPALITQEGITLRPLTPRHDSAVGATDIQFFHGSTSYAGGVTLPEVATHHISSNSKMISIRARAHADIDNMLPLFLIDDRVEVAVLEAAERLAARPTASALTVFERYRARFNAIAEADLISFVLDEFDPTMDSHGPRFIIARGIFDDIYASDPTFRAAYDANTGAIKELVDSYAGPDSFNPIASPGLQRLRAAFFTFSSPVTAVATYTSLKSAVQTASATLAPEDRTAVEDSNAWQRLLNDHVTTPARRQELRDIIATPPAPPPAVTPPAPVSPTPVTPSAGGAVTPQQFIDSVLLTGPAAPVPSIERDVAVTLTPESGVANPNVGISSQITVTPGTQASPAVSAASAWPNGATTGVAFSPQILVSTGAALDAQLALVNGPSGLTRTSPIPPLHFTLDDQRQTNFITAWEPELKFNSGQRQHVFVSGSSSVRYISGAQQFGLVGTIPNPPNENPRLTLSVEAQISRGGASIAGPQSTPWPVGTNRTATVLLSFTAPATFPASGLDSLDVQVRLLDAGSVMIDTRTIAVGVGPEATFTQAQAEAAWTDDFDFFHNDTPSLIDLMTASGESRRMGFANMVSNGLLTLHPMVVRHDSAAYVTQFNGGTPDPDRHAWLVNTPPYLPMPLPATMDPTHTIVASTSFAAMATGFTAVPGPFVCLNRTNDVATGGTRSVDSQMMLAAHEAVHAFDFVPSAAIAGQPINSYRTEFRAYWTDGRFGPPDQALVPGHPELTAQFDPSINPPGPKSPRAQLIFHHLYDNTGGYNYVRANYDSNTNHFREQVDTYLIPDGINLILSRRLELLRRVVDAGPGASFPTYRANIRSFFGVGAAPAAGILDVDELAYVAASRAWRDLIFARVMSATNRSTLLTDMGIPL